VQNIGTYSHQLSILPGLQSLLGQHVVHLRTGRSPRAAKVSAIIGWGLRPTTRKPRLIAQREALPFIALEDGFLRSFGTGAAYPTLSLVVDDIGIYYAADRASKLERLLQSDQDVLAGAGADYADARARFVSLGLSKYNLAPDLDHLPGPSSRRRILVVDQTVGDASVEYGLANASSFAQMLQAAKDENPDALIYVKTHPEVSGGAKKGFLSDTQEDERTILLRHPASPASLFRQIDQVYVVTSHMGFEALLHGVKVTCFGMPWYAGWGATHDRLKCERRIRRRSVDELFAAAYLHYTRYLNPETLERGTIFDVMNWLTLQRRMHQALPGRTIAVGYRRWKAENVRPFLSTDPKRVYFVANAKSAMALSPKAEDRLVVWGASPSEAIVELSYRSGASLLRMEDGFIRSVGLGSDFVPPNALVLDRQGLYFDARKTHDLEFLLNNYEFTLEDTERARRVRELIVDNRLTKYNIEPTHAARWPNTQCHTILVPGQVEDDASIRYGCGEIRDNLSLLRAARNAYPNAFIVYKPHPDVVVRNRHGKVHAKEALRFADHIETSISIVSCIERADEVHTMTSLSGFDALLRNKSVVTYGSPFYAGWGLTTDHRPPPRRTRRLELDLLIAGVMLHYPIYWDWVLNGYTTCEGALQRVIQQKSLLLHDKDFRGMRKSYIQRQSHKLRLWAKAKFLVAR